MQNSIKYITADEVNLHLSFKELLNGLENGFAHFSMGKEGGVFQPVRSVIPIEQHHGFFYTMPGYSAADQALACKLLTFYPASKDISTHQAWIFYFDPVDGKLLSIIDGNSITAARTAVASAVATKHLANPNARILAILGSGVQARAHYKAMKLLHNFDEVRVWGRTLENVKAFANEIGAKLCHNVEEAVNDADIICTVTSAQTPFLKAEWVKQGAHINAVGSSRHDWMELDPALTNSSVVYCDSQEACLKEAGDIIMAKAEIYGEIGEVVLGRKIAHWQKTTVFKSVGMAIEDVIAAKIVYDAITKSSTQ